MLDVQLVEAEDDEPHADPQVAVHDKRRVAQHVEGGADRQREDGQGGAQVGRSLSAG